MELNKDNFCIIMAGGFGSRLWPMSMSNSPKQFIDILGTGESMLQATFRRFEQVCPRENIYVVTGNKYTEQVLEQIPGLPAEQVLGEPARRNTAPCVAYAAAVIASHNPHANIIVTPADHAIFQEENFVRDLVHVMEITANSDRIVTLGARATNPETKYGYIQFSTVQDSVSRLRKVVTFTEKPPVEVAKEFIASGEFFWNMGIFGWNVATLTKVYERHLPKLFQWFFHPNSDLKALEVNRIYSVCESVSVDVGIMEKADNVYVLESSFGWSDVETWDSLYNTVTHDAEGNAEVSGQVFAYDTHNTVVHLPSHMKAVLQGLDDYIVASNDKVLMVCRRDQEEQIAKFASDVELQMIIDGYQKK